MLLIKVETGVVAVEESKPSEVKKEKASESPKVEIKKETTPTGERTSSASIWSWIISRQY